MIFEFFIFYHLDVDWNQIDSIEALWSQNVYDLVYLVSIVIAKMQIIFQEA
jgi:hypothetical protein